MAVNDEELRIMALNTNYRANIEIVRRPNEGGHLAVNGTLQVACRMPVHMLCEHMRAMEAFATPTDRLWC